ncbi:response regulator [Candidatus Chloroploca sp. Khr17]|uniref:response regulator n=1 Tax=Candidatus Chloroploca sp. Khr17 TaxID=2496869 RepID=UPI00101C6CB9|nr:response regulator [Candidatus Chloroploca sp. Khr17]
MAKPVILTVDDDPNVLSAVARDLRRRYAEQYRIVRADSGAAALEATRELRQRGEAVALFLADQRMPGMSGVEFLAQAMPIFPQARRALLTAYADTEAAIQAINSAAVHYYLLKPWDPPEEQLYPVLDDLLEEWQASHSPIFEGIRLLGHRWSPEAHALKDFLARNHVPYLYFDLETDPQARELLEQYGQPEPKLPLVRLVDGRWLVAPTVAELADQAGLLRQAAQTHYDLAIVGGGPAGLAAAVYGASEGLRTVLIEREAPGGQAGTSSRIENYLGFPSGLSGGDLARRAVAQARRFGVEILSPVEVVGMRIDGPYRFLQLNDGSEISTFAVVVAVGLSYRKLDAPGIEQLTGAGVYYGASLTEALSCQAQPVFIVGAGNSAGQAAIYLAEYAERVIMLVRGDSLGAKMSQYLVDRIEASLNIEVRLNSTVSAVHGSAHVEAVTVRAPDGGEERCPAAALFIFTGAMPCTGWLTEIVHLDRQGFIPTGPQVFEEGRRPKGWDVDREPFLLESSVPGIFVVGDARAGSVKRVASAVGEGSIAVQFVHQHLARLR